MHKLTEAAGTPTALTMLITQAFLRLFYYNDAMYNSKVL